MDEKLVEGLAEFLCERDDEITSYRPWKEYAHQDFYRDIAREALKFAQLKAEVKQ